ncbi:MULTISPECIES: (Fe-S)-binding protein [unclassified Paenibacillus]|uniref:(Fe-S)-binding protein n=1 Tax=unclassified Paenibacillus TaxID=185978 RepID=UPI0024066832|nr:MULTISPECIES: (Fe-S)-binding protein [unclassified Paenibacillus]MDF9839366.1 L-lactate dehydrogenase complex protein LldE [Paenibacillus sp. PastF-2]MDF9845947.1 L-lactate dehydrogenase complex protein LldE [Paenibacillus sp. PastM-2]MDF9852520.1 L-lactate dehydrogenase complex protein LldE [Paenibacillus sp. PastF-1]MDH6477750.1 L-lactate dehydrogenase complex protein LldE [Paenibacillus sp. PastH-2]MDH6505489.1 L-lactate dehydrogenase complex protein LldE [Paenibacillus sp. PastM-3]
MKVSIFSTCLVDLMTPAAGKAMVEVLERLGCELDFPASQVCCGQPTYNSGYLEDSKLAMKNMMLAFEHSDYVVGPSGSCIAMFHEYPKIFKGDPDWELKAVALKEKSYEFTQFIVRVLGTTDVGARLEGTATYHRSCHMTRLLGEKETPYQLLEQVRGLQLEPLKNSDNCCGFGGTFSVKMPEISWQMVDEKCDSVIETGADILISADMGCLLNIGGRLSRKGAPVKIMHIAEVLNQTGEPAAAAKGGISS